MPGDRMTSGGRDRSQPAGQFSPSTGAAIRGLRGTRSPRPLLANGVRLTARSFKYHRPRGIIGSGVEEPATLVELMGENRQRQPARNNRSAG